MPIKEIKTVQHRCKNGKGRLYEKQIALCECDQCGKVWESRRFDAGKPYTFCSRSCSNLASSNGGKIDELKRQIYLEKYGVDNPLKSKEVWERRKKKCLEMHGVEHVQHTDEWKEKRRSAIYEKYGDEMFKTEEFKKQSRETCFKKYGKDNFSQTEEFLERRKHTWDKIYGGYPMSFPEIKDKMLSTHIERYGCKTSFFLSSVQKKAYKNRLGFTREEYLESLPEYTAYRSEVRLITEKQPLSTLENFDKNRSRGEYHLDHIYSIRRGFLEGISPEIIGHICNLRFISAIENIKKGSKCDISQEELMEHYERQVRKAD